MAQLILRFLFPEYSVSGIFPAMDVVAVYKCLCDVTRLRILHLLQDGPLCVCHLQEILDESQVKMSKHLGYLKKHGLLESSRDNNWTIYSLPQKPHRLLEDNLKCLQDCRREMPIFQADRKRHRSLMKRLSRNEGLCPSVVVTGSKTGRTKSHCC